MMWMLQRVISLCKQLIHLKEPWSQMRTSAMTSINKRKTETKSFPTLVHKSPPPPPPVRLTSLWPRSTIELEWIRTVRVPSPYFHYIKILRFKHLICPQSFMYDTDVKICCILTSRTICTEARPVHRTPNIIWSITLTGAASPFTLECDTQIRDSLVSWS